MKLLIMGGQGMAGHMLVQYFRKLDAFSVYYTTRDRMDPNGLYADARDVVLIEKVIESVSPDVIINCIGILNDYARLDPVNAYWVNGIFSHQLAKAAEKVGGRLIHISTDCVFSGVRGDHMEDDQPDGTSVYAASKALGEVKYAPHLTIRTSIIGPEIRESGIGLLYWFMRQKGMVKGYKNMLWNGITTLELAKAVHHFIHHPVNGLIHLCGADKISKYELLKLFQIVFDKRDVTIVPDEEIHLDRTLQNTRSDFEYSVPGYKHMLIEMHPWMRFAAL
jgi:dTDP-4-dehydrorhamnose reductase